jgi:acetyltransferase
VEIVADKAIALPPLNAVLARDLIARTRIARLLGGFRDHPAADINAVCDTLIKLSHLVADIPEIAELDINPLLADEHGVLALDARIRAGVAAPAGVERFAIRPYPEELEERIDWEGRRVLLRPIKPEDGEQHVEFFNSLDPDDIRLRLFSPIRQMAASQLARFTQIDYDREMAFIATGSDAKGMAQTLGVARAIADPDNLVAEFAIIVRSDLKGRGLGAILLGKLIDYCRKHGTAQLVGDALTDNRRMIDLARQLGFTVAQGAGVVRMTLDLQPDSKSAR